MAGINAFIKKIQQKLGSVRQEMSAAEETISHFDDQLKLGAFERKKVGEYFTLKARQVPEQAEEFLSLAADFNKTSGAIQKTLQRTGYKMSAEDSAAYQRVSAWEGALQDKKLADDINSFIAQGRGEFAKQEPEVWRRLVKKDPTLANK